jgi:proteasome lid subunit RPN8/RPN11
VIVAEVTLAGEARATIEQHGVETYPYECCGALYGEATEGGFAVLEALRLPNTTADGPRRRFLIQPSDYRAAEAHARTTARTFIGFYHSHPDHPARPSQTDLDHAWPNMIYTITSVREGVARETTAWQLREDRSQFDERSLG